MAQPTNYPRMTGRVALTIRRKGNGIPHPSKVCLPFSNMAQDRKAYDNKQRVHIALCSQMESTACN